MNHTFLQAGVLALGWVVIQGCQGNQTKEPPPKPDQEQTTVDQNTWVSIRESHYTDHYSYSAPCDCYELQESDGEMYVVDSLRGVAQDTLYNVAISRGEFPLPVLTLLSMDEVQAIFQDEYGYVYETQFVYGSKDAFDRGMAVMLKETKKSSLARVALDKKDWDSFYEEALLGQTSRNWSGSLQRLVLSKQQLIMFTDGVSRIESPLTDEAADSYFQNIQNQEANQ